MIVELAIFSAVVTVANPGDAGLKFTTSKSSNNSCAAIDLANGSVEYFNIWFLAYIEGWP